LRGTIETASLVAAVQEILDRYEVLRTRLQWQHGRLIPIIDPPGSLQGAFEDWSGPGLAEGALLAAGKAGAQGPLVAPYDLGRERPCRALVLKLGEGLHSWVLATHHVVGDNWSLSHVMPADLLAVYDAHAAGRPALLPEIRLHYADYAAWQRSA